MKTAVTLADAVGLTKDDIFDLEGAYVGMLKTTVRDQDRQGYFHPSSVGSCGRKNVYEYIRAPAIQTIEPESLEIFDLGHAIHELVGNKLLKTGTYLKESNVGYNLRLEVPFDPATDQLFVDFGVGGTTDGVLDIWAATWRQRAVVETKSIGLKHFETLTGPKEDHLEQAHIYAYRFDAPIIYVWYYCKNDSRRKVYRVPYDHSILMRALKKFETWLEHVRNNTLPDRSEDWFACPRCEYRLVCQPSIIRNQSSRTHGKKLNVIRKNGQMR